MAPRAWKWITQGRPLSQEKTVEHMEKEAIVATLRSMLLKKMFKQLNAGLKVARAQCTCGAEDLAVAKKEFPGVLARTLKPWSKSRNLCMQSGMELDQLVQGVWRDGPRKNELPMSGVQQVL